MLVLFFMNLAARALEN